MAQQTIRVGIVGDSHFDETSRFEECVRLHDWIADVGFERGVDLWLHSGDVYERRSTPRERAAVAGWVQRLAHRAPLVIVRGNHDQLGDLPLLERLSTKHGVCVVEDARVVYATPNRLDAQGVSNAWGVRVACLAWPRKAELLAATGAGGEVAQQDGQAALRAVLGGFALRMDEEDRLGSPKPRILLAHAMVRGSVTSTGQPLVGCDHELGLDDLALAGAHVVALGHIHKGQAWEYAGMPIIYPGSPRRTAFGELEAKGYAVITFERGNAGWGLAGWEFVEAPATPMLLAEDEWTHAGWATGWRDIVQANVAGAEVRLRWTVAPDQREAARAAAEQTRSDLLARGASSVKVEEVVRPHATARAPEIGAAEGLPAQLDAYWRAARVELAGDRRERVLDMAAGLEGETQ